MELLTVIVKSANGAHSFRHSEQVLNVVGVVNMQIESYAAAALLVQRDANLGGEQAQCVNGVCMLSDASTIRPVPVAALPKQSRHDDWS